MTLTVIPLAEHLVSYQIKSKNAKIQSHYVSETTVLLVLKQRKMVSGVPAQNDQNVKALSSFLPMFSLRAFF